MVATTGPMPCTRCRPARSRARAFRPGACRHVDGGPDDGELLGVTVSRGICCSVGLVVVVWRRDPSGGSPMVKHRGVLVPIVALCALAAVACSSSKSDSGGSTSATAPSGNVLLVGTYQGVAGQYQTVQSAVDAAQPGDWVLVGSGGLPRAVRPHPSDRRLPGGRRHHHHPRPAPPGHGPQRRGHRRHEARQRRVQCGRRRPGLRSARLVTASRSAATASRCGRPTARRSTT